MKHISYFIVVFFILFLFQNTHAEDLVTWYDLSCFSEIIPEYNFTSQDSRIYFESKSPDIQIIQNNFPVTVVNVTESLKYVPFTYLIWDMSYSSNTSIPSLDTLETKILELSVEGLRAWDFRINFSHDARYHNAEYYMSDDGENYYRIGEQDSSDFDVQKLRVVFVSNQTEEIREVININRLTIERTNYIFSAYNGNFLENLDIYLSNTCKRNLLPTATASTNIIPLKIIEWPQTNHLYSERVQDNDGDGIKNLYDNCRNVSNRNQEDINTNGIGDACEFDSDGDSIPDEIDNCRNFPNIGQVDSDGDGIWNSCDNCEFYNPSQLDSDSNNIGDICDARKTFILENDDDGDGIVNNIDTCKNIANPDQADSDNDGIGDACDNCVTFQNSDQADLNNNGIGDICEDSDGDGIDSISDNCPNIANPDQEDSDNDGIWNICEDEDRDGVVFSRDNCPFDSNRDQRDTDNDSIGDACDESDDRFIESNKTIFIVLMILWILMFVWAIFHIAQKIRK